MVVSAIGLLLTLLHQPLLRYTLQRIGPVLAARAGIRLDWQVRGSLWRDVGLQKVAGSGGENHWLTRLEAGEVGAEYNLQALWRGDCAGLVERLHLRRLHLEADLRRLPPSRKKTPEASGPPPPVWPRQLDLEDLDLDVILADGSRLLVRGLCLRAGPGQPGTFHCSLLQREPGGLKLENLQAVLRWEPLRVELEKLALPSGLTLENASLDLSRLWQPASELSLRANGNRGQAGFRLETVVAGLFAPPRHLEADLSVRGLDTTAFAGLGLPQDLNVADATAELQLRGDPAKPRELAGEVRLTTAAWQAEGLRADRLKAGMELAEGRLRLTEVLLVRGANQLRLEGTADLPARLQDWRQTRWQAE